MLTTSIVLLLFALVAAMAGFGGFLSASVAPLGQATFLVLLLLAAVSFFMGRRRLKSTSSSSPSD